MLIALGDITVLLVTSIATGEHNTNLCQSGAHEQVHTLSLNMQITSTSWCEQM